MRPNNGEVTEEKELLMWGRHIMMGYANRPDATKKDMTEDGWLRSGDLVSIDNENFHAIVGREKDLIITAGGENIAPQPIHDLVKEQLPIISQVLLLGDKQKFVSCFLSLDIRILELYGMSETTGGHSFNTEKKFKMASVGAPLADCYKSKLMRPNNGEVTEEKELLMWGRHIMMGYANRPDATKKDMTEDGWLRSGDLVSIDNENFHAIVGREKDLIITAGGENIAPQPIHDLVKEQLPIISQVLLLGDKQKFVSCFLTLAVEVDTETMEPTEKLSSAARDWVQEQGSRATTVQEVLEGPDVAVMRGIQAGIDKANKQAVSNAQRIQKWMIIPKDFSLPGGELGPTMKVKRQAVTKKYEGCIEKIYNLA